MELWIPITVAAALFQNIRTALQKHLKSTLDTTGATYSRFLYAAPFSWIYLATLLHLNNTDFGEGHPAPTVNLEFFTYGAIGGLAQILATFLLVWLFGLRNFAVGTSLTKTEAIQTAFFGFILLGDKLSPQALFGIIVSLIGVITLYRRSNAPSEPTKKTANRFLSVLTRDKSILPGLLAGGLFGLSSISYRASSLSLGEGGFAIQSAYTLVWVTAFQTITMGLYILYRSPNTLKKVLKSWRSAIWVGLTGMLGSAGWFAAMTLENAAHVRTLGQIELIFTLVIGYLYFKENPAKKELAGMALITSGIVILLLE